jgi:hypothetical protein
MNRLLLSGTKVCICFGAAALSLGLVGPLVNTPDTSETKTAPSGLGVDLQLDSLHDILAPPLKQLHRFSEFYPHVRPVYRTITRRLQRFSAHFLREPDRIKASRELLRIQRRLFNALDAFALQLSESAALEDVTRASDDLKQTITDLLLGIDK